MEQRLESIINKGKIFALASIAALTINCQPLLNQPVKYDAEPEVLGYAVEQSGPCIPLHDSSIIPYGIKWSGSNDCGETASGVGTWCPEGEVYYEGNCYYIGDTYKIFDRYVPLLRKQGVPLEIGESCQPDEEVCESCY